MGLSRKRQRELKKLKRSADQLWDEQRETLEHAADVLRDARRQAANYAREEVGPRVRGGYEDRVKPLFATGVAKGRAVSRDARGKLADDVIPAVSGAIGSALAVLEAAKDPHVRDVVKRASSATATLSSRARKAVAPEPVKSSPGPGTYVLIGLGVLAVASVAYAAWQTLRADDDLWVEDIEAGEADVDEV
ncbi:hypothetical protein [uncultured Schumannella sp.]|uniref:hypothetical protein n=1 Tax=uncultured Schumannella sp. TaxID=1195956 RepID=UPI0025EDD8AA|nr:hypothetical protein [uncultured Schumannella sp.]